MEIREHVPLKDHTTFRVGGPARFFAVANTAPDVRALLREAKGRALPVLIMSGGSNLLVSDKGFNGLVIKVALTGIEFAEQTDGSVLAAAAAGEMWDDFVAECVARGLSGLENLSGIPGSVGATPVQNVGAYGVEVKDVIESVEALDTTDDRVKILRASECDFSYRNSRFKKERGRFVILRVTFRLSKILAPRLTYRDLALHFKDKPTPTLSEIRGAVLTIRARKFPDLAIYGTAGSFFKNPILENTEFVRLQERFSDVPHFSAGENKEKISLAWLLDHACNLRGTKYGNVGCFERQPLVIVNYGGATAANVRAFASLVASRVKEKTNIDIEPEVVVLD